MYEVVFATPIMLTQKGMCYSILTKLWWKIAWTEGD